jgi:hypothetical protein
MKAQRLVAPTPSRVAKVTEVGQVGHFLSLSSVRLDYV